MLTALLIIWSLVLLVGYSLHRMEVVRKVNKIPSPPALPLIGNILIFLGSTESIYKKVGRWRMKYKRLVAIWLGPWLNVVLFDPRDVEVVLKASKNMEKAMQYQFLKPWLGDSILISSGAKFRQNKKILVQTFHINNLKQYLTIFNEHATALVERLRTEVGKNEFNVLPNLSLCTMHTLLETSLGVDKELLGREALKYATGVEKIGRCVFIRIYKAWLYPEIFFKYSKLKKKQDQVMEVLNTLTNRVISERRKEYETQKMRDHETGEKTKLKVFVDNFFEATKQDGKPFTQEEIKDEVMTMMFAGQDTTTVSLGFALSLLGIHQDVQNKVVEELNNIFGDDYNRPVTYEDTQNMKYMEQVIQETWRLFPPIPVIAKTPSEDLQLENCVLPKGCSVLILIIMLHRNPMYFPNPDCFNPDNFLPDRIKERHPCSFIPFSAGYRTCIGPKYAMLLIKVVLSTILRNYKIISKRTMKQFVLAVETTLKRKGGFLIEMERREKVPHALSRGKLLLSYHS